MAGRPHATSYYDLQGIRKEGHKEKRKKAAYLCFRCDAVDGKDAEKKLQEKIEPVIGKKPNWEMYFVHDNGYFFSIPKFDLDVLVEGWDTANVYKRQLHHEKRLHQKTREKLRDAEKNFKDMLKILDAANELKNGLKESERSRLGTEIQRQESLKEPSQETTPRIDAPPQNLPRIGGLAAHTADESTSSRRRNSSYGGEETQRVERDSPPTGSEGIAAKVVEARGGNTMLPISSAGSQAPGESLIRSQGPSIGSLTRPQAEDNAEDPLVIRQGSRELLDKHRRGRVKATSASLSPLKYGQASFCIYRDGSVRPRRSQLSSENASPQSSNHVSESPRQSSSNADRASGAVVRFPTMRGGPVKPRSRFNDYPKTARNTPLPVDGARGSQAARNGQNRSREKPRASESGDMRAQRRASSSSSRAPNFAGQDLPPDAISHAYINKARSGSSQPSPISSHQELLRGRSANRQAAKDKGVAETGRQVPYTYR